MIGQAIGQYTILAKLGEGGMGEVYRARDSKLKREVAIKVLPADVATDRERLARFQREAEVLASLNHPHIAHVYGIEDNALVMELVEGEDLSQRIARGAIPIDEALPIAKQIAEALEAAHDAGIVHRDLKPANIKIRDDGTVKVLDFGLAKALDRGSGIGDQGSGEIANSPTITSPAMTMRGVILGTAAYMSPEQAKGKAVDKRADIWAFGCVFYEMLTGARAFKGGDVTDIITAVMRDAPDWNALPASTPPHVRALLRRCLEKDPRRRLRDIGDSQLGLEAPESNEARAGSQLSRPSVLALTAIAIIVALIGFAGGYLLRADAVVPTRSASRFVIDLPSDIALSGSVRNALAMAPDDTSLAFVAGTPTAQRVYVKWLNEPEARALPGTDSAEDIFYSPDGRSLGFFADRQLKKISLVDGTIVTLATAPDSTGATWTPGGTIVFAPGYAVGLARISANGGAITPLTERNAATREASHSWPDVLPDGDHVLYTIEYTGKPFDEADIGVVSLTTGVAKVVLKGGAFARYSASGHLVYAVRDRVLAVPFDTSRLEVVGEATTVLTGVSAEIGRGRTHLALSRSGSLAFAPGDFNVARGRELIWVGRDGSISPATTNKMGWANFSLSPGGDRALFQVTGSDDDIWLLDLARDMPTRMTFGNENFSPRFAPDGKQFAWTSDRDGPFNVYLSSVDNPQQVERLMSSSLDQLSTGFSPDGKSVIYVLVDPTTQGDIWRVPIDGERRPEPLVKTTFNDTMPAVSPDGRWLAYASNETGRYEVYVQPFSGPGPKQLVSDGRGTQLAMSLRGSEPERPLFWSRDNRELFYWNADQLMSVSVDPGAAFHAGPPRRVFELANTTEAAPSPDGKRFLAVREVKSLRLGKIVIALGGALEIGRAR